jgi:hypothetical protein
LAFFCAYTTQLFAVSEILLQGLSRRSQSGKCAGQPCNGLCRAGAQVPLRHFGLLSDDFGILFALDERTISGERVDRKV